MKPTFKQYLLAQGRRILEATIENANRHIASLSRVLQAQEALTDDLLVDLGKSDEATTIAMDILARDDTEILELRARISRPEASLASERLQHTES